MYNFNNSTGIMCFINRDGDTDIQIISSAFVTYGIKKKEYKISDNQKKYENKIGTFLFEFVYTDLMVFANFLNFFSKYIDGFISYFSEEFLAYFSNNRIIKENEYLNIVAKIYDKSINDIIAVQNQSKEILRLCLEDNENDSIDWQMLGPYNRLSFMNISSEYIKKYPFLHDSIEYIKFYFLIYTNGENGIESKWVEDFANSLETHPQVSYHCKNMIYLIPTLLFHLFWHEITISKCETCGRYFLADSKKAKYCNYISLDFPNKICNVVSREAAYKSTIEKSPLEKEYRKLYQKLEKTASRNPNNLASKEIFERFRVEGKIRKQDWKKGEVSDKEFMQWIHNYI